MFKLAIIQDILRTSPERFSLPRFEALTYILNRKYSNKVLPQVGLWDWIKAEEDWLHPGDGGSWSKVTFRLLVFEPQAGEILVGKIEHSFSGGLYVSLEFFDNIIIDRSALQVRIAENLVFFDDTEQVWIWKYQDNDLYLDVGEDIRFSEYAGIPNSKNTSSNVSSVMTVYGSIAGDGS
eukprot:jgi/Galph1/187/GphlegSOOS_G4994.1